MDINDIYKEYKHYEVFEKIRSIKNMIESMEIINKYELCQLCYINEICYDDESDFDDELDEIDETHKTHNINMIVSEHLTKDGSKYLCKNCKLYIYSKSDVLDLVQEILNNVYKYKGDNEFRKLISFFNGYVFNPYEKLLCEYLSESMGDFYHYHENCDHFIELSNEYDDPNILCEYILDIINKIDDIYFKPFIMICPIKYIEIFIKRGIDINHVFDNNTVFTELLYGFVSSSDEYDRISKLVELGVDVNKCNPLKELVGIQYENRPCKVQKIKYLISIGVNFSECKINEKLRNSRLGNLINELI